MSRIVITTFGSLGDLYPFIAIGLGLRERGHEVVIGTGACYRERIERLGLGFHAIRPDSDWLSDPEKVRRLSHPRWGLLRVGREWLMPGLCDSFADTLAAAKGTDLFVAMHASYATRLVAERENIPWASAIHLPIGFFSTHDPSILDMAPWLSKKLRSLGHRFWSPLFWTSKRLTRFLARPWYRLRAQIGLPATREGNPLADSHSPALVLALFSRTFADKQPDWPAQSVVTGFPFYDGNEKTPLPPELVRFLRAGPPPIVFTLGTAVSKTPGSFYRQGLACAQALQARAVLVVGKGNRNALRDLSLPAEAIAVEYAPFSQLFPHASVIVHHGGIGTTALAMRAGRPMLIIPWAWDQPDNAERAVRLGIARTISHSRFSAEQGAAELRQLLRNPTYMQRCEKIASELSRENGVGTACDAIESMLARPDAIGKATAGRDVS